MGQAESDVLDAIARGLWAAYTREHVRATGRRFVHYRLTERGERTCTTRAGRTRCRCGAYALEWAT